MTSLDSNQVSPEHKSQELPVQPTRSIHRKPDNKLTPVSLSQNNGAKTKEGISIKQFIFKIFIY